MSSFEFEASVWIWNGGTGTPWYLITLPFDVTDEIDEIITANQGGLGPVRVKATIGHTSFNTSVFPSKEHKSLLLPVKASVRKAEQLAAGTPCVVTLEPLDIS